jgi:glutaminyl-peptide cyclotransferase
MKNHTKHYYFKTNTTILSFVTILAGRLLIGCTAETIQQTRQATAIIVTPATVTPRATETLTSSSFDGQRALQDVATQLAFGPRTMGSQAHRETGDWIASELRQSGWQVEIQEAIVLGHPVRNIIGKWGKGRPWVTLGAHYDSRLAADQDPDLQKQSLPTLGANDGASGVAVLLELARVLPAQLAVDADQVSTQNGQDRKKAEQIWLVFFDAEDNGKIPGWDWIMGSRAFVESLTEKPDAAVIVDMIGDRDLNITFEKTSNMQINQEIWAEAAAQGFFNQFIPQPGRSILDDHRPFLEAGIPAVDLIDFDYPYWHTTADTLDKVSAESLKAVGETLVAWLKNGSALFSQP